MLYGEKPLVLKDADSLLSICVHSKRYTASCQVYFSEFAEVLDKIKIERNEILAQRKKKQKTRELVDLSKFVGIIP